MKELHNPSSTTATILPFILQINVEGVDLPFSMGLLLIMTVTV